MTELAVSCEKLRDPFVLQRGGEKKGDRKNGFKGEVCFRQNKKMFAKNFQKRQLVRQDGRMSDLLHGIRQICPVTSCQTCGESV